MKNKIHLKITRFNKTFKEIVEVTEDSKFWKELKETKKIFEKENKSKINKEELKEIAKLLILNS